MKTFCDIGGEFIFFMVDTLLTFDWMGVWELCFEELDAEFLVFNGVFGGGVLLFNGLFGFEVS